MSRATSWDDNLEAAVRTAIEHGGDAVTVRKQLAEIRRFRPPPPEPRLCYVTTGACVTFEALDAFVR